MKAIQFDVIATLISSREPTRSAARRVLVDGLAPADAAREFDIAPNSVSNTLRRFRDADALIQIAYVVREKSIDAHV